MASARIREIPVTTIDGGSTSLADYSDKVVMVVNVASKCGLTPQYEQLEQLQKAYGSRGFTVIGFPCNQFGGQEPGSAEEIVEFCSATYGVTFPLMEKIDVNGADAHPLYRELTGTPDGEHVAGDVQWNFEKFLITPDDTVTRFRPQTRPDDPEIVAMIEQALDRVSTT
ncbi:glutathione peroxidase [Gryllotalpicola protaetiae]|uniref:Glutathione peroxidase n=1 Tax=Gryllotalpicola protaetiae TaxID=2419771 RepID=A0A387BZG6_9MICO|nr:glutathione peroxidase [Gryllotalpicola protaetiae]AYG03731.1 glutathione peroxidase [Gryllotalpicola protaetiae]